MINLFKREQITNMEEYIQKEREFDNSKCIIKPPQLIPWQIAIAKAPITVTILGTDYDEIKEHIILLGKL